MTADSTENIFLIIVTLKRIEQKKVFMLFHFTIHYYLYVINSSISFIITYDFQ